MMLSCCHACMQVKDNMGALAVAPKLTDSVMHRIEAIIRTRPM